MQAPPVTRTTDTTTCAGLTATPVVERTERRGLCIVTVLGGETEDRITELRCAIVRMLGVDRPQPTPHLTFAVLHRHPCVQGVEHVVAGVAAGTPAVRSSGAGYGVFVGRHDEATVVHLAVTKTPRLAALHERLVGEIATHGAAVDGQYEPEHWRPHVTLAEVSLPADVGRVMELLVAWRPRHWTVDVDNLALLPAGEGPRTLHHLRPPTELQPPTSSTSADQVILE